MMMINSTRGGEQGTIDPTLRSADSDAGKPVVVETVALMSSSRSDPASSSCIPPRGAQTTYRSAIFVVTPLFMGYAALVSFQADIKTRIGITDESSSESYIFGEAVSLLFLAALLMRLLHNGVLSCLPPAHRVIASGMTMALAVGLVAALIFGLGFESLALVYVVYLCGGFAIGTFEANVVSCMTPLGDQTKKWGILGMPLGYNGCAIGGFALFALRPSDATLEGFVFAGVACCCVGGIVWFALGIPHPAFEASSAQSVVVLRHALVAWRRWLPQLWPNIAALFIDMFACILASTVALYVFNVDQVPLFATTGVTMSYNAFQALFNLCGFLGDVASRKVAYAPPRFWPSWAVSSSGNPLRFLALTSVGLILCLCKIGICAPIGFLLIMFGNGMIYATTTKHVDAHVPWEFNLVAISVWLFTGDCGSLIASTLTTAVSNAIGRIETS